MSVRPSVRWWQYRARCQGRRDEFGIRSSVCLALRAEVNDFLGRRRGGLNVFIEIAAQRNLSRYEPAGRLND
jgi:hypothetical protein